VTTLPVRVGMLVRDPANQLLLSSFSLHEIAIKAALGKIALTSRQATAALSDLNIQVISFTQVHALRVFDLPLLHTDPFDRAIIATALTERLPLVGGDRDFPKYQSEGLQVIW
jgi:PIN domain nuclease of toxin-antitoxin system